MATTKTQSFAGYVEVTSNLTVDTDTLHVDSVSNRVGIGKTNPQYELDIAGSINATDLYINGAVASSSPWSSNNANVYYTSGNVGIGTNAPSDELDVYGNVHVSNASVSATTSFNMGSYVEFSNTFTTSTTITPANGNNLLIVYLGMGFSSARESVDTSYLVSGVSGYSGSTPGSNTGAVVIFKRTGNTWGDEQVIYGSPGTNLGYAVDISNDGSYICASATNEPNPATGTGAVYVFTRSGSTWTQQTKLLAPGYPNVGLGAAINKDGTIVVASTNDDKIVHWTRNPTNNFWSLTTIINPQPGYGQVASYNNLRLSKDEDTSYIAAGDFATSSNAGGVYVYSRSGSTWTFNTKLYASDATPNYRLGREVDISGDTSRIIAGSFNRGPIGAAYIFRRTGSDWSSWTEETILAPPTGNDYGAGVAINYDGSQVVVGSPREAAGDGAIYFHERTGTSWDGGTRYITNIHTYYLGRSVYIGGTKSSGIYNFGSTRVEYHPTSPFTQVTYYGNQLYPKLEVNNQVQADGTILSFTGQHTCFPDGPLSQGQIVSANKNKYVSLNGPLTTGSQAIKSSESLPVVSLSNVANDTTVFGVVDYVENNESVRSQKSGLSIVAQDKELGDNRVVVNSLGEGAMWVVNTNGNLASGDYITTSNVAGYGQKQDDSDTLHSYTVAKITMDCDFNPQDVPIQVIKKDENGQNILDSYGRIQWEDGDEMESPYLMKYITADGCPIDEANAVWKAAYVGCTYHCG